MKKKIHTALIYVFYKDNLELIVRELHKQNVKLIATGGTLDGRFLYKKCLDFCIEIA